VTIINQGKIVATGNPEQLLQELKDSHGYELEVEGDTSSLSTKLQTIEGVENIEITPLKDWENRYCVQVTMKQNCDRGKEIAATIVYEGLGIYEMKRVKASLEDVFLQLTQTEANQE
jgi:ABC-2 type transport system ATP-binding protein